MEAQAIHQALRVIVQLLALLLLLEAVMDHEVLPLAAVALAVEEASDM